MPASLNNDGHPWGRSTTWFSRPNESRNHALAMPSFERTRIQVGCGRMRVSIHCEHPLFQKRVSLMILQVTSRMKGLVRQVDQTLKSIKASQDPNTVKHHGTIFWDQFRVARPESRFNDKECVNYIIMDQSYQIDWKIMICSPIGFRRTTRWNGQVVEQSTAAEELRYHARGEFLAKINVICFVDLRG